MLYACPKIEEDCQANPTQDPSLVCIELYEPVCGCNNITYSNKYQHVEHKDYILNDYNTVYF